MFLRNIWQVAAFAQELERPMLARQIIDEPVLLFRTEDGIYAIEDLCPHRLVPLSAGRREGNQIVCGYHGLRFGGDGKCTAMPGKVGAIPSSARVRTYPIVERWDLVWIWMGDPTLADPALLPNLHWLADPDWKSVNGMVHVDADYRLINDNLLDLSHETYVHSSSISNGESGEEIATFPLTITTDGRVLWAERQMDDIVAPPGLAAAMEIGDRVDRTQRAVYMAPALNLTEGIMRSRQPGSNAIASHRILHLLTPETSSTTHYFFIVSRDYKLDNEPLDAVTRDLGFAAFAEDKAMIECQQRSLARRPGAHVPKVAWGIDEAPVRGRRMLETQIATESKDPAALAAPTELIRGAA